MARPKRSKQPRRKCETCGGDIVETGQVIDGKTVVQHVNKRDERRCNRIWLAHQKAEATERIFTEIDRGR